MRSDNSIWLEQVKPGIQLGTSKFVCKQELVTGYANLLDAKHPIHVDENFAKTTKYGRCIAHGPLVFAQAITFVGGILGESVGVMLDVAQWNFYGPVFVDEPLELQCYVLDVARSKTNSTGVVTLEIRLINDSGDLLQRGVYRVLMKAEKN